MNKIVIVLNDYEIIILKSQKEHEDMKSKLTIVIFLNLWFQN